MSGKIEIRVHKASASSADCPVPDLLIQATEGFPSHDLSIYAQKAAHIHEVNAKAIGTALIATLPGGTIDRLLVFLLEHQVSLLRVRHPDRD